MPFLIILLSYLLGSIPTAYIAGRLIKGKDIRQMGDGNMGARNAFRQLGAKTGLSVGIIDSLKGILAILIAQITVDELPEPVCTEHRSCNYTCHFCAEPHFINERLHSPAPVLATSIIE